MKPVILLSLSAAGAPGWRKKFVSVAAYSRQPARVRLIAPSDWLGRRRLLSRGLWTGQLTDADPQQQSVNFRRTYETNSKHTFSTNYSHHPHPSDCVHRLGTTQRFSFFPRYLFF